MKLDKEYRLEKVVSRDETRIHINHAHLDVEAKRLVATNGHILASVPAEVGPSDRTGPMPREAVSCARSGCEITARKGLVANGRTMWVRPKEAKFPDWKAVVPKYRKGSKGHITISFNPKYLAALAEAIGESGRFDTVTLTFPPPKPDGVMLEPIVVEKFGADEEDAPFGVLMPARWK